MEHEVGRLRALVAELSDPHEVAAAYERIRADLARIEAALARADQERSHAQSKVARIEEERVYLQAELDEARARLARVAWRERTHNAIARLSRIKR